VILLVGRNGFIGRHLAAALAGRPHRLLAHDDPWAELLGPAVSCLLWCGRDPRLGTADWRREDDLETVAARACADRGVPLISLSSRKVYAPAAAPLGEGSPLGPVDRYGEQKLALEEALEAILGPLLTRLRLANIFGWEPGRRSFAGRMLDRLAAKGEILFDVSPFTPRDFLPVEVAAAWILRLAEEPPGGVVNLGSGLAVPVGRMALWLIAGFGAGRLLITDPAERDPFLLDTTRLRKLLGETIGEPEIAAACRGLGRRLARSGPGTMPPAQPSRRGM